MNIFLNTGPCDSTGNRRLTGSLQQEYLHSWQQLANDDVVLIQLGVGVDVKITPRRWRCGAGHSCGSGSGLFRIGNSSVVVMWYVPRPRVQALILLGKTRECHKLIRLVKKWWPDN